MDDDTWTLHALKLSRALVKSSVDLCIPSVQLGSGSSFSASDFCLLLLLLLFLTLDVLNEFSKLLQVKFVHFLKSYESPNPFLEGLFWLMKNCYSKSSDICNFNDTLIKITQNRESQFSLSIAWDQGNKLRWRSLSTGNLNHWAICLSA